jgi:hypothetical protein
MTKMRQGQYVIVMTRKICAHKDYNMDSLLLTFLLEAVILHSVA